jgi:hypothetical protein
MTITNITTGEQSVTSTGAITGVLSTATLATDFTLKIRVRGLAAGDSILIAFEDTASSSAFSDKTQIATVNIVGGQNANEGVVYNFRSYEVPTMRYGSTNDAIRVNCLAITGALPLCTLGWKSK